MVGDALPVLKDLVLVGGGHSHVAVLRRFGMIPMPGVRLTLVAREARAPYSGMLPGVVGGYYRPDEALIDLRPLARFAGARFLQDEALAIDLDERRLRLRDRPDLSFDALSINVGSAPSASDVDGVAEHAWPVKPIDGFLSHWARLRADIAERGDRATTVTVVGGGVAGAELALFAARTFAEEAPSVRVRLVGGAGRLLSDHDARAGAYVERALKRRGVEVVTGRSVVSVSEDSLTLDDGSTLETDRLLWATNASPPAWLAQSGLAVDEQGFVAVAATLQSTSHPFVFAAGDAAAVLDHPRPKSGVFAVRQGPPLEANLRRYLRGDRLVPYRPQRRALALIGTGDGKAVASRGRFVARGRAVWWLKRAIDRRFIRRYTQLPDMDADRAGVAAPGAPRDGAALEELSNAVMRCGGCGAKVGADVLHSVLGELDVTLPDGVELAAGDDAAVLRLPDGHVGVHTVDLFRSFIDDPFTFAAVAANHALGDVYAMGAQPFAAMAIVQLPYASEEKTASDLRQLMAGAVSILQREGCALVGGHTAEAAETAVGFALTGHAPEALLKRKGGARVGDRLVLTKALGTGVVLAADMRARARGEWVEACLDSMLASSADAARLLGEYGAGAMTDVTGFGFLGHLVEMLQAGEVAATVELDRVLLLPGVEELVKAGVFSSMYERNLRLRRAIADPERFAGRAAYCVLFDPQTAGGLLASVPADKAASCVEALRGLGCEAADVGFVRAASESDVAVELV